MEVVALAVVILACVECGKAWGAGGVIAWLLPGLVITFFVPFGSIAAVPLGIGVGAMARNARMRKVMEKLDQEDVSSAQSRGKNLAASNNPFASADTPSDGPRKSA